MNTKMFCITVAIATFNSERTLPLVLEALKRQEGFKEGELEILLVDGGSSDGTENIGKKFGCKFIKNPRTEPVYAKYLALQQASSDYLVYLDHDEVLLNTKSLISRLSFLKKNPDYKFILASGYQKPEGSPAINYYLNDYGDPFSYFIYGIAKSENHFIEEMKQHYTIEIENAEFIVFDFKNTEELPLIELCASAAMLDRKFILSKLQNEMNEFYNIPHIFYLLQPFNTKLVIAKNDPIAHHSIEKIGSYFKKIRWRIKNNIFHISEMGESGFAGRLKFTSQAVQDKKYIFLPYAFSVFFPLVDACKLSLKNKRLVYFLHLPLALYTAFFICFYFLLSLFKHNVKIRSYDESVELNNASLKNDGILFFQGTAAELIKTYPVIKALQAQNKSVEIFFSGQASKSFHSQWSELLLGKYSTFSTRAGDLSSSFDALWWFFTTLVSGIFSLKWRQKIFGSIFVVHGDTLSTLLGAIFAKFHGAKRIIHLEAGRRSGNIWRPFPEEITRRIVSKLAKIHLCENIQCIENLKKENCKGDFVHTFGNTQQVAIEMRQKSVQSSEIKMPYAVLNLHRFENTVFHWQDILKVTKQCANGRTAYFLCHGHVQECFSKNEIDDLENAGVVFLPRLDFFQFLDLLEHAEFLVTDGSGNQDDIFLLGTPTLILRKELENKIGLAPDGPAILSPWDWNVIEDFFEKYKSLRMNEKSADTKILKAVLDVF